MRGFLVHATVATVLASAAIVSVAQQMPSTAGETLSGKHVVPAELVRGHVAILIAAFSHDAGMQSGEWRKAVLADTALKEIPVYELAMLEKAPGIIRGMIKGGMRKGLSPAEQDHTVVMTQDQKLWEKYFGVENDKEPYLVMLNASGEVMWRGHGPPAANEPLLKGALKH